MIRISFGLETAVPEILKLIKKDVPLDAYVAANRINNKRGIETIKSVMLGLPGETRESIRATVDFLCKARDIHHTTYGIAMPYPGTELYEMAKQNGWFTNKDKTDLVESGGLQQSTLEYPGLSKDKIAEELDRFYRSYYMRPKPVLRIIKTMLEDKDVFVRRTREGFEFFKSLAQRKADRAARAVPA